VSISSDDDTHTTESDSKYDSERDPDLDIRMEDDLYAPHGVDLDGEVDMKGEGEDQEIEEQEDVKEEEEVDENEEEDEDKDNGKELRTIGQGEMVNSLIGDADTMVDDTPTVLREKGQMMRKHAPQP
jgi:hypothetical protein